ncbi:MAG: hypothetical protein IJX01_02465 [Oscillospiraceae bacterium]|nr:hypothetical protein [Oscillospiraceae bacterium]
MENETVNKNILTQFDQSAKQFCEKTNGIACDITNVYKNEEKKQNLQHRYAKIYYNTFTLKFVYTPHGIMGVVNSVLSCLVSFDKNEEAIEIPLPLMTDYCDMNVAMPMCVPLITNKTGMAQAFTCLQTALIDLLPVVAEIGADSQQRAKILAAFCNEILSVLGIEPSAQISQAIIDWSVVRFATGAFLVNLKGNRRKAAKKLRKTKKLTGYEKRMIALWESNEAYDYPDISAIVENAEAYNESGVEKFSHRELFSVLTSAVILTPVISVAYLALYFLLMALQSWNAVYLMGPIYNFPIAIFAAFMTGFSVSYFTRHKAYKWLYKKHYDKYCEMDHIQNGETADKIMKWFTGIVIAGSLVVCTLFPYWNLRFLPAGFVDNSKFLSLKGRYYDYSQVERVYYKADRENDFGEVLEFPSYVLVLKDGKEIDLYEHGEISDYDPKLLDHLREKGVKIEK